MSSFIPYGKQWIEKDDIERVIEILNDDFITTGPKIEEFEKRICKECGCKFAVATSSGTAALHISSLSILNKGDRVLTTPNSFLATSNAILYAQATPIFVDINKDGNINLDECIKILEKEQSIKAIYVVHFSGNPVEQKKLEYIKENFNVKILEDCSHSLGAYEDRVKAGSCKNSDMSTLSFHPVKHITTGEGGAVTTNDERIYKKLLSLRNHGVVKDNFENIKLAFDEKGNKNPWYYEMQQLGFNYRITDFQCALGISQFDKLNGFLKKRRYLADRYDKALKDNDIIKPLYTYRKNSSYHLYVVMIDFSLLSITKAELFYMAKDNNIGFQVHYIPIYKQPYYVKLGYGGLNLENTETYYKQAVSIPMYPRLTEKEQDFVINFLLDTIERHKI